jgi:hypothetical protein
MSEAISKFEQLRGKLPQVNKVMGIVLLVLNIFLPGVGTLICACIGPKFEADNIIVGLLQLLLSGCIIGWVWSIWWGIIILQKSSG